MVETNIKILELRVTVDSLKRQVEELQSDLAYCRQKLNEAQERNRKLDWTLTKVVEEL